MLKTITAPHVILKIVCWIVLLIVTIVGCSAHFQSTFKSDKWDTTKYEYSCKALEARHDNVIKCPTGAMAMERTFAAFTIIFIMLTAISVVATFLLDMSRFKIPETALYATAGLAILLAGILMIVAAVKIDEFVAQYTNWIGETGAKGGIRKGVKHSNKLAAGAMAVIIAILHLATAERIFQAK